MADKPNIKILAFAGSTRQRSFNKQLVRIAAHGAQAAGAEVKLVDLREYTLPLYDGDLETQDGLPANALALQQLFLQHQGLLLACPEYNSSITGVLKNTLDWVSRPTPGQASLACFQGKVVSLMSASPGTLGGLRGLVHARAILSNLGCLVLPEQRAIGKASEAFTETGSLRDAGQQQAVLQLGENLVQVVSKLIR